MTHRRWLPRLISTVVVPLVIIAWIALDVELTSLAGIIRCWYGVDGFLRDLSITWFEEHRSAWIPRAVGASLLILVVLAAIGWEWFIWYRQKDRVAKNDLRRIEASAFVWTLAPILLLVTTISYAESVAKLALRLRVGVPAKIVEEVAPRLLSDWPTDFVDLPGLGKVGVHPRQPNHLYILPQRFSPTPVTRFALTIDRSPAGDALVFWLDSSGFAGGSR